MSRLELAKSQIIAARSYTLLLLEGLSDAEWFFVPQEVSTHVAWQAAHIGMAQFRLAVIRSRGERETDEAIVPQRYIRDFGIGSKPEVDPQKNPTPGEILAMMERANQASLECITQLTESQLDEPTAGNHPRFNTKLGALLWCSQHEMLHAGQIGLLRRMMGRPPRW